MTKKYFLPEWTTKVLKDTGWTQSELAKKSGLSRTAINDVVNRKTRGGYKYALAIAEAAGRPVEEALQAAGLMDIPPALDEKWQELVHLYNSMSSENRDDTIDYARMKLEKQERENKKDGKRARVG